MSRFDDKPLPDYQPVLRIDMRLQSEGGAPRIPAVAHWRAGRIVPQHELLVLVHGYNNHEQEAREAYACMRRRQKGRLDSASMQAALDQMLGDVFWPGDAQWAGALDRLDFMHYSGAVHVAPGVGQALAAYLRRRKDVLVVHFLAHSLGCRVVLEAMRSLAVEGGPKVGKVCLMAAAVPTYMVAPSGDLYGAFTQVEALRVLYSPADPVLGAAFPPGQMLAGEGLFPTAVGRYGDVPLQGGVIDRDHIEGARHGDYWGAQDNIPCSLSETSVAEFFRFDGVSRRSLPSRQLPPARADLPARHLATGDFGPYTGG